MINPDKTYIKYKSAWDRTDDCMDGQDAVKSGGTKYLPKTSGMVVDDSGDEIYSRYLENAVFYNFTGRTHDAMLGVICNRQPDMMLPAYFDGIKIDGRQDIVSFARDRVSGVLSKYRDGVLVDWKNDAPIAVHYPAQTILAVYEDDSLLAITLEEMVTILEDGELKDIRQLRKLVMIDGAYHSQVYRMDKDKKWQVVSDEVPLMAGYPIPYIPFVFFTPIGDSAHVDYSILNDIAVLNIAHYRNSADYENLNKDIGHPTPCVSGLNVAASRTRSGYIATGTGTVLQFDPGGNWGYLEHSGTSPAELRQAMNDKISIAASLGARIISGERREAESAEAQSIRASGERGVLSVIAAGVSKSMERMLQIMADWAGVQGEIAFVLRPDTGLADLGYERIKTMLELDLAGYRLPERDIFRLLKEHGLISDGTTYDDWAVGRVDG